MALRLNTIKNADKVKNYRIRERLDPDLLRRNFKRREIGKLYRIELADFTKDWIQRFSSLDVLGSLAAYQDPKTGKYNQTLLIPENEIVIYLGTRNKVRAKVLWEERICLISRSDLSLEPISS